MNSSLTLKHTFQTEPSVSIYSEPIFAEAHVGQFNNLPDKGFTIVTGRLRTETDGSPNTMASFAIILDKQKADRDPADAKLGFYLFPTYKSSRPDFYGGMSYTEMPSYSDSKFNGIDDEVNICAINCKVTDLAVDGARQQRLLILDHVPLPPGGEFLIGIENLTGAQTGPNNRIFYKLYSFASMAKS